MKTLEQQLDAAGLRVFGCCEKISAYGPDLLQHAPLLQDFSPTEADVLGASLRLVRAEPGQLMMREGEAGEWMMLVLKGTVDVTKRVWRDGEAPPGGIAPEAAAIGIPAGFNAANDANGAIGASDAASPPASPEVTRVGVVRRGTALGEMSLLDGEPRFASCTAIEEVEAAVLGRHEIGLLIRDHPAVAAKLLVNITQLMAQRLRNTSNQLIKLLHKK
ncbi:Crp/Fnr family transcriptional regulator [Polaromonas sp.]|uniref:Crp/Fnr family transcriptional regulator n=1 Tax=Polaromonas sp. TaxID=1869339 RepID=UPI0017E43DDB|nr:Crp/Fnr family transcriptional regulator [Polaromonas sp.]NMM08365.1 Crp/Fnr family transcriptional regulator [Polaromonas sp.]